MEKDGRRLEIKIPAGAQTGTKVRLAGEGGPGMMGGQAGHLYLQVKVQPGGQFERQGGRPVRDVPVDLYTALLGGKARVQTLSGPVIADHPARDAERTDDPPAGQGDAQAAGKRRVRGSVCQDRRAAARPT